MVEVFVFGDLTGVLGFRTPAVGDLGRTESRGGVLGSVKVGAATRARLD